MGYCLIFFLSCELSDRLLKVWWQDYLSALISAQLCPYMKWSEALIRIAQVILICVLTVSFGELGSFWVCLHFRKQHIVEEPWAVQPAFFNICNLPSVSCCCEPFVVRVLHVQRSHCTIPAISSALFSLRWCLSCDARADKLNFWLEVIYCLPKQIMLPYVLSPFYDANYSSVQLGT